jgi:hypothetical protein
MLLTETVNTADPLLNPHWIPRHVVINERSAELEVQAFGGGVSAQ